MPRNPPSLTFYPRLGGKSRSAFKLIADFPADCRTYVEPFAGAGNIVLRMPKGRFDREIVNDLDPRMYQLLNDVRLVGVGDIADMDFTPEKTKWEWCKSNGTKLLPSAERFHANIYTVWYSFSGMTNNFAPRPRSVDRFKARLPKIQARMKDMEITNADAFDLVRLHKDNPDAFIFLDPPYLDTCCKAYSNQTIDVVGLRDLLRSARCKWMVTYNDHPDLVELYEGFHLTRHDVRYTNGGKHRFKSEIIITNYQLPSTV